MGDLTVGCLLSLWMDTSIQRFFLNQKSSGCVKLDQNYLLILLLIHFSVQVNLFTSLCTIKERINYRQSLKEDKRAAGSTLRWETDMTFQTWTGGPKTGQVVTLPLRSITQHPSLFSSRFRFIAGKRLASVWPFAPVLFEL